LNRVDNHPILGKAEPKNKVTIYVDNNPLEAFEGESIAAALLALNMRVCRLTPKRQEPRGIFCGIGQCTDCVMEVNGIPNVRTCITPVRDGMRINTQVGLGKWQNDKET